MDYDDYSGIAGNGGLRDFLVGYYKDTPDTITPNQEMRYYSFDGSYIYAIIFPSGGQVKWRVTLPDGTTITQRTSIQRIRDTNGNSIKIERTATGGVSTTRWIDENAGADPQTQAVREIQYVYDSAGNNNQGLGQVKYRTVGSNNWVTIDVNFGTTVLSGGAYKWGDPNCADAATLADTSITVVRSIVLPQTELQPLTRKQFSFSYNTDTTAATMHYRLDCSPTYYDKPMSRGWGSLSQMTMPSNATVDYSYNLDYESGTPFPVNPTDVPRERLVQKRLTHDGTPDTWTYNVSSGGGSVSGPDGSNTQETFYPHDPALALIYGGGDGRGGLVYKSIQSGKVKIERHWTLRSFSGSATVATGSRTLVPFNPVVDTEYTTLLGSTGQPVLMSAKTFQYDLNGNMTEEKSYDWFDPASVTRDEDVPNLPTGVPAGAHLRRTTTNSYHNPTTIPGNVYAKRTIGDPPTPLILNALQQTITGASQTRLSYDSLAYGTSPTAGNVTLEEHWDDGTASDGTAKWLPITYGYDVYGNRTSITDPRGNVTSLVFDSLTHAQPISATVDPNNQITGDELTTTTVYDYWTGLVTSVTDPNGKITSSSYANQLLGMTDPFGRPGIVTDPQGRKTVTRYLDNTRKVEVWSDLNSPDDALLKSRSLHDELGRVVKTESAEDGVSYTIFAKSVYEQMGRTTISTNPMRTAGATTDGWTRTSRDDLGRVVTVETLNGRYPEGTSTGVVSTSYTPDATTLKFSTTVTDQAGKLRRSITDGLGRLTRVDEPNSSNDPGPLATPVQPTTYSYDAVDNLTSVTQIQGNPQATQTRTFSYDSLKRLKKAINPESETITYTYDDNSNLKSKTDARGVITTYGYDGLNRATTRSYSGAAPGPATPNVTYVYDTLGASLNGKGRLTSVSSSVSSYSYGSYDVMGRVLTGTQTTDGQNYGMIYQYNLAGGMTTETYPSNKVVVTEYDPAGRISGVKRQATEMYYAGGSAGSSGMQYAAHGAVKAMRLGNGRWERTSFNSRLQPTQMTVDANVSGSNTLQLDYGYGTATANNGNVMSQTITAPKIGGGNLVLSQNYGYDALNRLSSAEELIGTTSQWKQNYDYDRFGNRAVRSASAAINPSTYIPNPVLTPQSANSTDFSAFNQGTNRIALAGFGYDASGNLTGDATTAANAMVYDGENRLTKYNNTVGQYTYDGDGRRVKKTDNTGTTVFVYNVAGQLIAEYTSFCARRGQA